MFVTLDQNEQAHSSMDHKQGACCWKQHCNVKMTNRTCKWMKLNEIADVVVQVHNKPCAYTCAG